MRVLVTGGTGVIGVGLLPRLIDRGYCVRLLTRNADKAAAAWPAVEPFTGDVADPEQLEGAADGCDAIVHVSGIVEESPPDLTFERVNVGGTRNILAEAARAEVPRFVYVSSLGAERGASRYHQSKLAAERLVREYEGSWAIVRPGNVYGPGDEVISQLLRLVRTLPAVPVIGSGDYAFQPVFFADLGEALAVAAEATDLTGVFEVAGDDTTTLAQILEKLSALTGRRPVLLPVPETVAGTVARFAEAAGLPFPIDDAKFKMLIEENVIDGASTNALTSVFGVTATPLDEGLAFLADAQPAQLPSEGFGALSLKRFWADVRGSGHDAESLMVLVRERCTELMTVEFDAEPEAPQEIVEGATLTAAVPMRGNVQVRVLEVTPTRFTFGTLRGHPLAGIVRFETETLDDETVRFAISVYARAASMMDWLAIAAVGGYLQNQNWSAVVRGVADSIGGDATDVQVAGTICDDETAAAIEREIDGLVTARQRADNSAA